MSQFFCLLSLAATIAFAALSNWLAIGFLLTAGAFSVAWAIEADRRQRAEIKRRNREHSAAMDVAKAMRAQAASYRNN